MNEHAHLHQHTDATAPKINFTQNLRELAIAATRNIPNAEAAVKEYFDNGDTFERLPPETQDRIQHLGFGNVY